MFVYAMEYDELIREFKKRIIINNNPILIIYMIDKVYAIDDRCTHMGASLLKGTVKDNTIKCKSHHVIFNFQTGEVIEKPHIGFIKMSAEPIKVYETLVKENKIFVKI